RLPVRVRLRAARQRAAGAAGQGVRGRRPRRVHARDLAAQGHRRHRLACQPTSYFLNGDDAMKTIVALPGEGIGIEVVEATCEVLEGAGLGLKILHPPQGAAAMKEHGTPIPEETKRAAREADGVLFGAAGPSSSAVVSWLRWEMDAYAGVRPVRF